MNTFAKKRMFRKAGYIICVSWSMAVLSVCGQSSYDKAVTQGLIFQVQADSMLRLVEANVLALATTPNEQKEDLKNVITDFNTQSIAFQKKADEWFAKALEFEKNTATVVTNDSKPNAEKTVNVTVDAVVESTKKPEIKKNQEFEFVIMPQSPYSETNPIPIDNPLPDGVVYKIQLGAFSKPLATNTFKGLSPISGERLPSGITKYYVGLFRRFADAEDALRKVHEYGFKESYIIAFYNRKTINPERAKQLETNSF